ncbi:unnamed protein product, partial [Brassica rapa subsp. trilocularis]
MAKFGLNQLDNGRPNRIKCLGALLRFFFDSSFSFSIPLPCVRFVFLFFVLLWFSFDSFDSPSISEAKNNSNPFDGQKQAFVVVGRVSTGIEAKLKEVCEKLLQLLVDLSRRYCFTFFCLLLSSVVYGTCSYIVIYMNADTLNLNDDDYLSVEDMMAENKDEQNAQADSVTSAAQARGNK